MFSCIVHTVWEVIKEQARLISYYPHGFPTTRTPILLSRFVNLETCTDPPLTFEHTTPAIAYTSGMFSLPSAAACEWAHPTRHRERPFGRRGSVFGFQGSIDQSIDVQSIAPDRFVRQPPKADSQPVCGLAHRARVPTQ